MSETFEQIEIDKEAEIEGFNTAPKSVNIPADIPPFYLRILAYCIAAATFACGMYSDMLDTNYSVVTGICVGFPFLSHWATMGFRDKFDEQITASLLILDSFLCGFAIVLIKFALVPSIMFVVMTSASVMTVIGQKGWLGSMVSLGIGGFVGAGIFGHEHLFEPPLAVTLVSVIGVFAYICVTAFYAHQQALVLLSAQKELISQQNNAARFSRKLAKYLPPQVWGSIFSGRKDVKLETQRKKLTVFFSDIKGFSDISEELQPEALTDLLNNYFNEMSQIASRYGGTIDKFIGDAIMIFFGDPNTKGSQKDALACVSMAIEMRKKMKVLKQQWHRHGVTKPLQIRMGINTGYCTVGNFGAESRMDYTIVGKEVNLASRLESVAEPGQIFISQGTYSMVKETIMCRDRGSLNVKGFAKPVPIYEVVGFRKDLASQQSFLEHELEGFSMYLDIEEIKNYDQERVVQALLEAAHKVKNKVIN